MQGNLAGMRRSSLRPGMQSKARRSSIGMMQGRKPAKATKKRQSLASEITGTQGVTVLDEAGVDRTPKPLLSLKPSVRVGGGAGGHAGSGHSTPNSEMSEAERTSVSDGFGPALSEGSMSPTIDHSTGADMDGLMSPPNEPVDAPRTTLSSTLVVSEMGPVVAKGKAGPVTLTLRETETIFMLEIPSVCIASDVEEAKAVEVRNEEYRKVLKERATSELFTEKDTQTVNPIVKAKQVQSRTQKTSTFSCQVSNWAIHDSYRAQAKGVEDVTRDYAPSLALLDKDKISPIELKLEGLIAAEKRKEGGKVPKPATEFLENLKPDLTLTERAVMQNVYHEKLLTFRNFAPKQFKDKDTPQLLHLWDFYCDEVKGRNVSCMASNKIQQDLLAVGYGEFKFMEQKDGLIGFWSLKNPQYPEFMIRTECGVTALDFSASNGNLLAVGMYNGTVAIYDVRSREQTPVLESGHQGGKHSDPVWKLRWIDLGSDRGESLVSISTDGRITQWSIKKGLEFTDLMKLKRVARKGGGQKSEAFISRRSSGMCFDFSTRDPSIYVVGTEEGNIHKCSCSYSEQYLESYQGHMGPVYQIAWSPFSSGYFLSASNDWSIKLWSEDQEAPLLTFQSGTEEIHDVCWSPTNSTVFGAVSGGKVEVWDLSVSILKPATYSQSGAFGTFGCIRFAENSPVLFVGSSSGGVKVYRLVGTDHSEISTQEEQAQKFKAAMESNVISPSSAEAK